MACSYIGQNIQTLTGSYTSFLIRCLEEDSSRSVISNPIEICTEFANFSSNFHQDFIIAQNEILTLEATNCLNNTTKYGKLPQDRQKYHPWFLLNYLSNAQE